MGWARKDRGIPAGQTQASVGSSVSSGGKDQDPLKQLQVRGGDSSGEGGRDGHKGPTVTRVVTLSARPALTLDLSRIIYHLI